MENVNVNNKSFFELFPEMDSSRCRQYFENLKIDNINIYKKSKKLEIHTISDKLIPVKEIMNIEKNLCECFNLNCVNLKLKYNFDIELKDLLQEYWSELILYINKKVAVSRAIINDSKWELNQGKLIVKLKNKGAEILKARECHTLLEVAINDFFSHRVKVIFDDDIFDNELKDRYLQFKEEEESRVVSSSVVINKEDFVEFNEPVVEIKSQENNKKDTKKPSNPNVILGKAFNESTIKISEVTQDSGKVAICGDIFSVDIRQLNSGKFLIIFDITDYTSSLTAKCFINPDKIQDVKENIKEGATIKLCGEAQYDKFSKELVVFTKDIMKASKNVKVDDAKQKRVELHLHTQMSAMDAVSSTKDIIKRAAQWGHEAIAITDHGVVQAFPEAMEAAKKNNIKVIYGVECYLLDDNVSIVYGSSEVDLDDEFVVFDIETTGFSPKNDSITEIGAVKIKDGKIIDEFNVFVNPGKPIPEHIVKLTGITDNMVKDALPIEGVLPSFIEFIGKAPVVAHNAPFDMGFIQHNARLNGHRIENAVVDTLILSRKLFPELKKHKLNVVAKHLGIDLENHHRAVDDAKATGEIFIKCLELLKEKGVNELNQINDILGDFDYKKSKTYHAIILAKDYVGLKNLYKIISESHLNYFHKVARIPKKLFMSHREGLILGSACEAGEVYSAILDGKSDEDVEKIAKFYDYLEIQPLGNNQFLVENNKLRDREDLKDINRKIVKLGEKLNKLVVATCDVHFLDPKDEVFRRILMAGKGFSDADNQAPLYFRTTNEMLDEFTYLGSEKAFEVVVENTNKISNMVENILPIPEGTFPPVIDGAEKEIRELAEGKAYEIYGNPLPETVHKRLEKELNSIIKNGFSVMYIISQKLVWKSVSDGYLVGSRGSVGSSFVANMTGITEVNSLPPHYVCEKCKFSEFIEDGSYGCGFDMPDKSCPKCGNPLKKDGYDIPFETFLGFDGDKEPDIDLNFSGEYQAIAHKYTEVLFGKGHVYKAGTIGTIAEKTAYGFVKNYLDEREIILNNAEINRLVKGCSGVKRTTGQHPGGIMVVPSNNNIFEFCPIQRPADDVQSDIITTHFDYHSISGRLLKLDILGHDDPTVIKMLEDLTGVDATKIEIGEKKTMGIFSSTEPLGIKPEDVNSEVGTFAIPEFGTKFVRQMLVDTKPKTFSELIRISGLSHGTDVWLNNAQDLVRDGVAKLGEVICTRDDIMLYLIYSGIHDKTAFKIMEDVRKGKGLKEEYEQTMRENNVPEWYIQSCKKIKYMFPKAHAAAYVMMAFRIAWFKVYYPEAFYVTYFTVRADDFDASIMCKGKNEVEKRIKEFEQKGNTLTQKEKNVLTILEVTNEMYARGIKFLPLDLYKSEAKKFQVLPDGIRPPLNSLQGLGDSAAENIVEARKNGEFLSMDDLRIRAKVSKTVIEILKENGCLEGLPETNQLSIFGM